MKYLKLCVVLLLALVATSAAPTQDVWRDEHGRPSPDTDARKSAKGFGAWVVVTSDADWQQKWETPSDTSPRFTEAHRVQRGQTVFVLTFFTNPRLKDGHADVTADIDFVRADGTSSVHQVDAECYRGPIAEDPHHLFLSKPVIGFLGEPQDPLGRWVVRIKVRDNVRHVTLPLTTSFELE
jgi:hypothetical protein